MLPSATKSNIQKRMDEFQWKESKPGWWFGTFFVFPCIGNNHPNWLIIFRGVQTTNQLGFEWFEGPDFKLAPSSGRKSQDGPFAGDLVAWSWRFHHLNGHHVGSRWIRTIITWYQQPVTNSSDVSMKSCHPKRMHQTNCCMVLFFTWKPETSLGFWTSISFTKTTTEEAPAAPRDQDWAIGIRVSSRWTYGKLGFDHRSQLVT